MNGATVIKKKKKQKREILLSLSHFFLLHLRRNSASKQWILFMRQNSTFGRVRINCSWKSPNMRNALFQLE